MVKDNSAPHRFLSDVNEMLRGCFPGGYRQFASNSLQRVVPMLSWYFGTHANYSLAKALIAEPDELRSHRKLKSRLRDLIDPAVEERVFERAFTRARKTCIWNELHETQFNATVLRELRMLSVPPITDENLSLTMRIGGPLEDSRCVIAQVESWLDFQIQVVDHADDLRVLSLHYSRPLPQAA